MVAAMIESMQEYKSQRYKPLEREMLEALGRELSRNAAAVRTCCLQAWREALAEAVRVQQAAKTSCPCAYMSISLLNTSLLPPEQPLLQMDFYDEGGAYGWPWARTRTSAAFLFRHWEAFKAAALDDACFVRSRVHRSGIRALFWETIDRMAYLFTCHAKYIVPELESTEEYQQLLRAPSFFITSGMYLDWQEQLYAERPAIDIFAPDADEDTSFRQFSGMIFRGRLFQSMELQHCRFRDCLFADCTFAAVNLMDVQFLDCRFHRTIFRETEIAGCLWQNCALRGCSFLAVYSVTRADSDEYFAEAELRQCYLENVQVQHCDFTNCRLRASRVRRLELQDTAVGDDSWAGGDSHG